MLWARSTFGLRSLHATTNTTSGGLVTTGPYRYWRHPIYASIIYFVWAGQVEMPTVVSVSLAIAVTAGLLLRMVVEEQFLVTAYPEYFEYMRHAKRLVPFVFQALELPPDNSFKRAPATNISASERINGRHLPEAYNECFSSSRASCAWCSRCK